MFAFVCLCVLRLYINVIFCYCGCLWDYHFNVFDCLNNYFSLTLSSRTSPFREPLISFFGVDYREQCVYLYVNAPYNTTYVFQKKYSLLPLLK